jgi:hypothetical protein
LLGIKTTPQFVMLSPQHAKNWQGDKRFDALGTIQSHWDTSRGVNR